MATLYIDIDAAVHRAIKVRAAEEGRTLGALVHEALAQYLSVERDWAAPASARARRPRGGR